MKKIPIIVLYICVGIISALAGVIIGTYGAIWYLGLWI